jgi:hypothetical protein
MTEKALALRLAEELEWQTHWKPHAAELRRLHEEHIEDQSVIAVWRGRTLRAEQQRDELLAALKEITPNMPPPDAPCHYGIVPQSRCCHCQRIARARAAIAKAEGKK